MNFGVNPWENMFNHVLTHVESPQTQNMIRSSYLEPKHLIFWKLSGIQCRQPICKHDFYLSDTVLIIDYSKLNIFPMGN